MKEDILMWKVRKSKRNESSVDGIALSAEATETLVIFEKLKVFSPKTLNHIPKSFNLIESNKRKK
ncbi:MAG: hypothetical protein II969_19115 [Anaerolineaceae bacterium]|nr:hypothetical protein [Anaerolineaceae bacterium]